MIKLLTKLFKILFVKNSFPIASLNRNQRMIYLGIMQTNEKNYIKEYDKGEKW